MEFILNSFLILPEYDPNNRGVQNFSMVMQNSWGRNFGTSNIPNVEHNQEFDSTVSAPLLMPSTLTSLSSIHQD